MKPWCKIDDCMRPVHNGRGWCVMHYFRWRRHGDPLVVKQIQGGDPAARFWSKVDKNGPGGCWIWMGARSVGYGQIWWSRRVSWAHRVSYELNVGPIPEGLTIDHLCRVPLCVNPNHLEPVTPKENCRRGVAGWNMSIRTHCPQGHPYSPENTWTNHRGHRWCRACHRERGRTRRAKQRMEMAQP